MKKIISFLASFCTVLFFAQGKLIVYNYSPYKLSYTLVASMPNSTCTPNFTGNNYQNPLAPNDSTVYYGCSESDQSNSPINSWDFQPQIGTTIPLNLPFNMAHSTMASLTNWQMAKFEVSNGQNIPNSGAAIGTINCNSNFVGFLDSNNGYPFDAYWFVLSTGETIFLVK
jgi:hypothetical protein